MEVHTWIAAAAVGLALAAPNIEGTDLGDFLVGTPQDEAVLARGPEHVEGAPLARRTLARHPDNPWPLGISPMLG